MERDCYGQRLLGSVFIPFCSNQSSPNYALGQFKSGGIPASREFLSFSNALSKWEGNVLNRASQDPSCIWYSSVFPLLIWMRELKVCQCCKAQMSCILAYCREDLCLQRFHGRALRLSRIQKTLSERKDFCVQKENMPEADISFKVAAKGKSYNPFSTLMFDKAEVIITLN